MRSEFQFFQSSADEQAFIDAFLTESDSLEKDSEVQWFFRVGDCRIQFIRSPRRDGIVGLGRIALATHGFGLSFISAPAAEALFRKMRTWLKNRYHNRLRAENVRIPGSTTSYRTLWIGPDAQASFRRGLVSLKSIITGYVVFSEEPEAEALN